MVEPEPVEVPVAAQPQPVLDGLRGPGAGQGLVRVDEPVGRAQGEGDSRDPPDRAHRARCDAVVDAALQQGRHQHAGQRVERDQGEGDAEQSAHRAQDRAQGGRGLLGDVREHLRRDLGEPVAGRRGLGLALSPGLRIGPQLGRCTGRTCVDLVGVAREQLLEDDAAFGEFGVRSAVGDAAVVEHDDPVGELQGGAAAGDEDGDPVAADVALQGAVDGGLGRGVDRGGRVVDDQHLRPLQQRPCEGEALALSAGEVLATLGQFGVVAGGQGGDERVRARRLGRGDDLLVGGVLMSVGDVLADAAGEEEGLLEDDADVGAERFQAQFADVGASVGGAEGDGS